MSSVKSFFIMFVFCLINSFFSCSKELIMDSPGDPLYNNDIIIRGVQFKHNIDSIQIILEPLDDIKIIPNPVEVPKTWFRNKYTTYNKKMWLRVTKTHYSKDSTSNDIIYIHHNPYGKNFEIQGQERKFNFEVRKNGTLLFKKMLIIKSEYAPNKKFWKLKTEKLELHNMDYVEKINKKSNYIEIRYTKK